MKFYKLYAKSIANEILIGYSGRKGILINNGVFVGNGYFVNDKYDRLYLDIDCDELVIGEKYKVFTGGIMIK